MLHLKEKVPGKDKRLSEVGKRRNKCLPHELPSMWRIYISVLHQLSIGSTVRRIRSDLNNLYEMKQNTIFFKKRIYI